MSRLCGGTLDYSLSTRYVRHSPCQALLSHGWVSLAKSALTDPWPLSILPLE